MAQGDFNYFHISANGSFLIRSGVGELVRIVINNPGTTWVLNVYDATSAVAANLIATIAVVATEPYVFETALTNGLFVVASGTAGDATVVYA